MRRKLNVGDRNRFSQQTGTTKNHRPRPHTWHKRPKVLLVLGLPRGRHRSQSSAVERLLGGNDDRLGDAQLGVGVLPGKLEGVKHVNKDK